MRIVTYNINADTDEFASDPQAADLETVFQGLGEVHLDDNGTSNAQPVDIFALEELSNGAGYVGAPTIATLVNNLNAYYGAGTYAYDPTVDPTDGGTTGNGPSGIIYDTHTVQIVSATPLGTASGSGAPRAPMQYFIQPIGYSSAADFYLDVSHAKSGTDSGSAERRNDEAQTLVSNANSLGSSAHIVAVGDYNITSGSSEATYQTLTSYFHDVGDPGEYWDDETTTEAKEISGLLSESATDVRYRDDIQFVSAAAMNNSGSPGLQYDSGSYLVFGNGGNSSLVGNDVSDASANPGALSDLSPSQSSAILAAEDGATDHLPVVADYSIVGLSASVPEPASVSVLAICGLLAVRRPSVRRGRR